MEVPFVATDQPWIFSSVSLHDGLNISFGKGEYVLHTDELYQINGIICVEAELKEGDQSASAKLLLPLRLRQTNGMKVSEQPLCSN